MKSKTTNLIAIVPLTLAAIVTVTTVVYLVASAEPEARKPGDGSSDPAPSSESHGIGNPSALAPAVSSEESAAKPRNAAERLANSLSSEQHSRLLALLNEGTPKDLHKIDGVGKTRAEAIEAARPFEFVAELAKVNGVGEVTFASVIEYGKQIEENGSVVAVAPSSMR